MRLTLRADAILHLALGLVLLSSTWDALFDKLDLPRAEPEIFTQIAGGLLVAVGYLLWIAPRDVRLAYAVALTAAVANAAGALFVAAWLLFAELGIGRLGTTLLSFVAVIVTVFAALEARIAARSVAGLLPPD